MAEKSGLQKAIVIPQTHHYNHHQRYQKETQESKTYHQSKFYIAPNRESRPAGLPANRIYTDIFDKKINPSFEDFNLSAMFTNKLLTDNQLIQFKKEKISIIDIYETPAKKKHDNIHFKQTQDRLNHSQVKRSRPKQKGLRQLSQRAYEIVLNMRSASYKEVANLLVELLNNQKQTDDSRIQQKDQQNIKRRVYDALNVLIALGVLRKQGRKIVGDRSIKLNVQQQDDKKKLIEQIQLKKKSIKIKRYELQKKQTQYKVYKQLVKQNKIRSQQSNKFNLPFLVVDASTNNLHFSQNNQNGLTKIQIKKQKQIIGKMDFELYNEYEKLQKNKKNI